MQLGDYESALTLFDKILSRVPDDPVTNASKGHALKTGGRSEDAITAYRAALKSQPFYCDAWYSLANAAHDSHDLFALPMFQIFAEALTRT